MSARERGVSTTEVERSSWSLQDDRVVLERVAPVTGLPKGTSQTADLTTLGDDTLPYLHDQVSGRPLWKVSITGARIQLPSTPAGFRDRYERTIDVLLDPVGGGFVALSSRWPIGEAPMPPEPGAKSAAEQMTRSGGETYHGFPTVQPGVSFINALDAIQRGGGSPLIAKQIIAHYVMWSRAGKWAEPRAVWAITLRGIPPVMAPPGTASGALDKFRFIVDGQTGKLLCGSNTPRPDQFLLATP